MAVFRFIEGWYKTRLRARLPAADQLLHKPITATRPGKLQSREFDAPECHFADRMEAVGGR